MKDKKPICEDCGVFLKQDRHELYCPACGMVYDDAPVNFGPEHVFGGDMEKAQRTRRTGPPKSYLNPDIKTTFW